MILLGRDASTLLDEDALDFFDVVETVARDAGFTFHNPADALDVDAKPEWDPDLETWGEGEGAAAEQNATMSWLREQGIAPLAPVEEAG